MTNQRARDLGIQFPGAPGKPNNAITDVPNVAVGHSTIIGGQLVTQTRPRKKRKKRAQADVDPTVNTGVTAVVPDRNSALDSVVNCGFFSLNGNGEMTGTHLIEESGILQGPIILTNTAILGTVRSYIIQYGLSKMVSGYLLPVVAETDDSLLNNINNNIITQKMVVSAYKNAKTYSLAEGSVVGGTGMTCYDWKGGIGTSSRKVKVNGIGNDGTKLNDQEVTVGVLVQANQGTYDELVVMGVPIGRLKGFPIPNLPSDSSSGGKRSHSSIIVVIATDAPLQPHQLKRLARRGGLGIARTGTSTHDDSGELCIAFSTTFTSDVLTSSNKGLAYIDNDAMDPLFTATVQATEEAIINALLAATEVTGPDNFTATKLCAEKLVAAFNQYNPMTAIFLF